MRFLIVSLWAAAAGAYGADSPTSSILACADVPADAARLSCYDGVARALRAQPPAAVSAAPTTATAAPAPTTAAPLAVAPATGNTTPAPGAPTVAAQTREFGLPPVKAPPADEIKAVKAIVTATHHGPNGALVIELDNGQRWQQLGSVDMGLQAGDSVTISRALLGSFWLAPPNGRGSKVSRMH